MDKMIQQLLDDINSSFEPIAQEMESNLNLLENFLGQEYTKFDKLTIEDLQDNSIS